MSHRPAPPTLVEVRERLLPFCQRHPIRRLDVFGSVAAGTAVSASDVDLLVALHEDAEVTSSHLLEMAGEAEELLGVRVDFVLRRNLESSPRAAQRAAILASAVCIYGA